MKSTILLISGIISLQFSSTETPYSSCEDDAWIMAEIIYDGTGDGFQAGAAFEETLLLCEIASYGWL